jgi:hypothetical protein
MFPRYVFIDRDQKSRQARRGCPESAINTASSSPATVAESARGMPLAARTRFCAATIVSEIFLGSAWAFYLQLQHTLKRHTPHFDARSMCETQFAKINP